MVSPMTADAHEELHEEYETATFGLWVDCPPRTVLNEGYFRAARDLGFTEFAVMIDDAPRRWKPTWSLGQWERLCRLADEFSVSLAVTTWPYPDKRTLDTMYADIEHYVGMAPFVVQGEESDTEFNWKASKVKGFRGRTIAGRGRVSAFDLAGDYLVDLKRECAASVGRERTEFKCPPPLCYQEPHKEQTTFAGHLEAGPNADVAPHMDIMFMQMYSVATRKRTNAEGKRVSYPVPWGHTYGPGNMQKWSIDRAHLIPGVPSGKVLLAAGLAGWNQKFQGHSIEEAIREAFLETILLGIRRIRVWSSKWLLGARSDSARQREVRRCMALMGQMLRWFRVEEFEEMLVTSTGVGSGPE